MTLIPMEIEILAGPEFSELNNLQDSQSANLKIR